MIASRLARILGVGQVSSIARDEYGQTPRAHRSRVEQMWDSISGQRALGMLFHECMPVVVSDRLSRPGTWVSAYRVLSRRIAKVW